MWHTGLIVYLLVRSHCHSRFPHLSYVMCINLVLIESLLFIISLYHKIGAGISREKFLSDTIYWQDQVRHYWRLMDVEENEVRNVMDMSAFLGGFAVALSTWPVWVMNVVPATTVNTLPAIYDRGLIGAFHDW